MNQIEYLIFDELYIKYYRLFYVPCTTTGVTGPTNILRFASEMRITDWQVQKCRRRRDIWKRRAAVAVLQDADLEMVEIAIRMAWKEHHNVERLKLRRRHVKGVWFNINRLSDHQCLKYFRFTNQDIGCSAKD